MEGDSVVGGSAFNVAASQMLGGCAGVVDDPVRLFVCEVSEAESRKIDYCESWSDAHDMEMCAYLVVGNREVVNVS